MVGEKLQQFVPDREPVLRQLNDRVSGRTHKLRNRPGDILQRFPEFKNRNFGGGRGVGIVEAAIITILEDVIGFPFGADADVASVSKVGDNKLKYTVNVNAPNENLAEARAFLDAGTGFTTILTEKLDVENVEVLSKNTLRDTYQIEILVEQ